MARTWERFSQKDGVGWSRVCVRGTGIGVFHLAGRRDRFDWSYERFLRRCYQDFLEAEPQPLGDDGNLVLMWRRDVPHLRSRYEPSPAPPSPRPAPASEEREA